MRTGWASANARQDPLKGKTAITRTMWERDHRAAEKYNEPGRFTAFIGLRMDLDARTATTCIATSSSATARTRPTRSFRFPSTTARRRGPLEVDGDLREEDRRPVLAIPHNGNLSNGLMFDDVTLTTKKPLDRDYAERRMKWEPLYETTQMKGDGETHPALSPNDEFANFERWDKGSFGPSLTRRTCCRASTRARPQARPRLRGQARRQPVQVRPDRLDRFTHLACRPPRRTTSSARSCRSSRRPIRFASRK